MVSHPDMRWAKEEGWGAGAGEEDKDESEAVTQTGEHATFRFETVLLASI